MPKPTQCPIRLQVPVSLEPGNPAAGEFLGNVPTQPSARFFGVPFLKGTAQQITSIHLCPAMVHLATIRDGAELEVCNRLTFKTLDLGELSAARLLAFRPRAGAEEPIEMAIAGPMGKPDIARYDLAGASAMASLPLPGATAIQYSADGRFVAAGNGGGQVRVWHLGPGDPALVQEAFLDSRVESLAFHPEHPTVYATLASGALAEVDLAPSLAAPVLEALREKAPGVLFHLVTAGRQGYPIYLAGRDERVYVVDTATGDVYVFSPGVGPIISIQVLPNSGHLCVLGRHAVYLFSPVRSGQREHLALVCAFEETLYAAWELDQDAVLVFHAADGSGPS